MLNGPADVQTYIDGLTLNGAQNGEDGAIGWRDGGIRQCRHAPTGT